MQQDGFDTFFADDWLVFSRRDPTYVKLLFNDFEMFFKAFGLKAHKSFVFFVEVCHEDKTEICK